MKRVLGCIIIISAILFRTLVLDVYVTSPDFILYSMLEMWLLAPVAFLLSVIVFLILGFTNKIKITAQLLAFVYSVFGWACAGLGIALFIIFVFSVYTQGAQTPFAFIFFDGPLGAGVGTVVGFAMWVINLRYS